MWFFLLPSFREIIGFWVQTISFSVFCSCLSTTKHHVRLTTRKKKERRNTRSFVAMKALLFQVNEFEFLVPIWQKTNEAENQPLLEKGRALFSRKEQPKKRDSWKSGFRWTTAAPRLSKVYENIELALLHACLLGLPGNNQIRTVGFDQKPWIRGLTWNCRMFQMTRNHHAEQKNEKEQKETERRRWQ